MATPHMHLFFAILSWVAYLSVGFLGVGVVSTSVQLWRRRKDLLTEARRKVSPELYSDLSLTPENTPEYRQARELYLLEREAHLVRLLEEDMQRKRQELGQAEKRGEPARNMPRAEPMELVTSMPAK